MIYLKPRQAGEMVNYKRVERLYAAERFRCVDGRGRRCPRWTASHWCVRRGSIVVTSGLSLRPHRRGSGVEVPGDHGRDDRSRGRCRGAGSLWTAGDTHSQAAADRTRLAEGVADRQRPQVLRRAMLTWAHDCAVGALRQRMVRPLAGGPQRCERLDPRSALRQRAVSVGGAAALGGGGAADSTLACLEHRRQWEGLCDTGTHAAASCHQIRRRPAPP